jgi:uncharacterized protein involved in exopolysaccharide biosynthesis
LVFKGRFYESTDNAYVQGEITRVSSQLGTHRQVLVQDNQHEEGLLVRLEAMISTWPSTAPTQPRHSRSALASPGKLSRNKAA